MVRVLARIIGVGVGVGVGVETADMLVHEVLSRNLRDRRALARLTRAAADGGRRDWRSRATPGCAPRVRGGLIQLAWRFLLFQKDSARVQWYRTRTEGGTGKRKTTMIVTLARKLLIAFWRWVTTGGALTGVTLRPAVSSGRWEIKALAALRMSARACR